MGLTGLCCEYGHRVQGAGFRAESIERRAQGEGRRVKDEKQRIPVNGHRESVSDNMFMVRL